MAKGAVDGCGLNVLKYIMFAVNFVFWLAGGALMGVAIYAMVEMKDYKDIFESAGHLPIGVLILGIVVFIIGFLGCCGAIKESTGMLKVYFAFVLILVIGEIVVVIVGFVEKDNASEWVSDNLTQAYVDAFQTASVSTSTKDAIINMQKEFKCCGVKTVDFTTITTSGFDATEAANVCISSTAGLNVVDSTPVAPGSLNCIIGTSSPLDSCKTATAAQEQTCCGCYNVLLDWIQDNIVLVAGVAAGIAACQIFGLIFTCCLISGINKSSYA